MNGMKYPTLVLLGLNTICNYNCIFCNNSKISGNLSNLSNFLTPDVNLLIENAKQIDISGYGEILLNPEFHNLVDLLSQYKKNFSFSTNGSLLTPLIVDYLDNSSLYLLNISLNSLNEYTYKFINKNGNLSIVLSNLDYLFSKKRNFQISISMVLIEQTIIEIEDFIRYAHKKQANKLRLLPLVPSIVDYPPTILIQDKIKYENYLLNAKKLVEELEVNIQMPNISHSNEITKSYSIEKSEADNKIKCRAPWIMVGIDFMMNVLPCCWLGSMIMGNLNKEKFVDIWNNEKYKDLRKSIENGSVKYCKHCLEFG